MDMVLFRSSLRLYRKKSLESMGFGTQLSNQGLLLPLPVLKKEAVSLNKTVSWTWNPQYWKCPIYGGGGAKVPHI
jgi:hypothetical protein